jgi:AcrR family transcriptional regulator
MRIPCADLAPTLRFAGSGQVTKGFGAHREYAVSMPDAHERGTRQALIEAAVEVIAAEGIVGATTRRITDAAGLPLGALHYWFATKGHLLEAVAEHILARIAERMGQAGQAPDLADQLLWLFEDSGRYAPEEQLAFFEITMQSLRAPAPVTSRTGQGDVAGFGEKMLEPWRAGADATLPGGFPALVALVKSATIGMWFERLSLDEHDIRPGMELLAELLRHVPRADPTD